VTAFTLGDKPRGTRPAPPVDDEPTKTSNRALFNVNNRYYIDPMCEEHDTEDAASAVQNAYDYAGVSFVVEAVQQGVFSREDALEHLPEAEHQAIESAL